MASAAAVAVVPLKTTEKWRNNKPLILQMAIEWNDFITIHHQARVHFENLTEVKFRDILLTGMGHRDRRLNRDSPGQTGTYGRSVYPEVVFSRRIHLWEGKSASNRPCESSDASPDRCGQERWILVAVWGRTDVVTAGTFLGHVCPAVGCPGRNSRRRGLGWYRRFNGEKRNWLLLFGCTACGQTW